jgi:cytochrome c oxidase subunit 2
MHAWPVLEPGSPQAAALWHMFAVTLAVCAAIFTLVAGLVVFVVVRYREGRRPGTPPPSFGNARLEAFWTGASILVVTGLLMLAFQAMRTSDAATSRAPDLVVVGHQWWWEVRYPGSGVITANEIHIPVGRNLVVRLESADVIHDFWVPELGRKMDMVPGHPNTVWLRADRPGTYQGECSEYCGAEHAWMRFLVVAEAAGQFDRWLARQGEAAPPPATDATARGRRIFESKMCASCHAIAGTAARARVGPDLTHLASRRQLAGGVVANTPVELARWLRRPSAIKPGVHMPDLALTGPELSDLVNYLETLK